MRINWQHLIFVLIMLGVWAMTMLCFIKLGTDAKEERQEYLRESFSPMTEDPEIQEAYDAIRDPVFDVNAYVIDGDTLATENQ